VGNKNKIGFIVSLFKIDTTKRSSIYVGPVLAAYARDKSEGNVQALTLKQN
jgi:hypothetical protein